MTSNHNPLNTTNQSSTSFNPTMLTGSQTYMKWRRDLHLIAAHHGIYTPPPQIDDYITNIDTILSSPKYKDKDDKPLLKDLLLQSVETQLEQDLKAQEKKSEDKLKAMALLILHVSPSIRSILSDYTDPYQAFQYLSTRYKMNNPHILHREIANLTLDDCSDLNDFFGTLGDKVQNLRELNHSYDDCAVQAKIMRSLTPEYDGIIREMNLVYNGPRQTWPSLEEFKERLLEEEEEIMERKVEQGSSTRDKKRKCPV
ncbi:hypothetical protein BO94DRAFT_543358 [Aspergillus sclerotioniger CBS 115572]|uniref:Uncharacterized protein n=1 Tax=Aspergillus sclerotioniger CBS 115572 TaxID=1450535 RepID=A0A317X8Y5_9EURO|nr:hypothetical protein BO94DRAFT_543358 [Aspergillus sclerotioniger CBS 115572]PWY94102.1 hypothetical protein BO94DRAFT_543358 [Aspergillus sclerotioniger CBS 115572]